MRREYRIYESRKLLLRKLFILIFSALLLLILFILLDNDLKSYLLVIILTLLGEAVLISESIKIMKKLSNREALIRINKRGILVSRNISEIGIIEYDNIDYCEFKQLYIHKTYGVEKKKVFRIIFKIDKFKYWHTLDIPIDYVDEPNILSNMLDKYNVKVYS